MQGPLNTRDFADRAYGHASEGACGFSDLRFWEMPRSSGPPDAIGFDHCTRQRECAVCGADDDGVLLDLLVGDVCRAGQPHSG